MHYPVSVRFLIPALLMAALITCDSPTGTRVVGPPAKLEAISGDAQTGRIGTELPNAVVARIVDANGRPVPQQLVNFRVVSGGGSVFGGASLTNAEGIAQERWTLGMVAGEQKVEARAVDATTGEAIVFGSFTAIATAGDAATLVLVTPPSASAANRNVFPTQPVVHAKDAHGNVVLETGRQVSVTISAGGGALGGGATVTTANDGTATYTDLSIGGIVGERTLTFSSPGLPSVSATVTTTPGAPAAVEVQDGNQQSGLVTDAVPRWLQIRVMDVDGNRVIGAPVSFAVTGGGGSIGDADAVTGSFGIASLRRWHLGPNPGANAVTATVAGLATTFTATGFTLQQISTGRYHACAVTNLGAGYCWGRYEALGSQTGNESRMVPVAGNLVFRQIANGDNHSCGVTTANTGYCWGSDYYGTLGDNPSAVSLPTPQPVAGAMLVRSFALGAFHTCAVTTDDVAWCWGTQTYGQLGDGVYGTGGSAVRGLFASMPQRVLGDLAFRSFTAGGSHSCGLTAAGQAYCWGDNMTGQLGIGGPAPEPHPIFYVAYTVSSRPLPVAGSLTFTSLTGGYAHTCGLTAAGVAYCWGANGSAQLGDGSTQDRFSPTPVAGGITFQSLTAGLLHTCGISTSGAAYCWGSNQHGQLGDGTTTNRITPALIAGGLHFQMLGAGGQHSCGITTAGLPYCWGGNSWGEVGDGTNANRTTPTRVR